jgi:hypothetical protein
MTTATLKPPAIPAAFPLLRYSDAFRFQYTDAYRELFNKLLKDFVPPNSSTRTLTSTICGTSFPRRPMPISPHAPRLTMT